MEKQFLMQSLIVWFVFVMLYSIITAYWDAYSKNNNQYISMKRKLIRSIVILFINMYMFYPLYTYYGLTIIESILLPIIFHNVYWIIFELILNENTNETFDYISDDGINENTSWDDKIFHNIGKKLYGKRGHIYSGFIKFSFKIILLIFCIILVIWI